MQVSNVIFFAEELGGGQDCEKQRVTGGSRKERELTIAIFLENGSASIAKRTTNAHIKWQNIRSCQGSNLGYQK